MKVVSREEWTQARTALLFREKEFSREREALSLLSSSCASLSVVSAFAVSHKH